MSRPNCARTLEEALEAMSWEVLPGRFALLGFAEPPGPLDLASVVPGPGQVIREGGETTLLVPLELLARAREAHPQARVEHDLAWIRFRAEMSWEVVGFLARVTSQLAAAGVPLGAVCGFSRDHLFVAEAHLPRAREVLERLLGPERRPSPGRDRAALEEPAPGREPGPGGATPDARAGPRSG